MRLAGSENSLGALLSRYLRNGPVCAKLGSTSGPILFPVSPLFHYLFYLFSELTVTGPALQKDLDQVQVFSQQHFLLASLAKDAGDRAESLAGQIAHRLYDLVQEDWDGSLVRSLLSGKECLEILLDRISEVSFPLADSPDAPAGLTDLDRLIFHFTPDLRSQVALTGYQAAHADGFVSGSLSPGEDVSMLDLSAEEAPSGEEESASSNEEAVNDGELGSEGESGSSGGSGGDDTSGSEDEESEIN